MVNPFVTLMECFTGTPNATTLMNYNPDHICNLMGPSRTDYVTRKRQRHYEGATKVVRHKKNQVPASKQLSLDRWTVSGPFGPGTVGGGRT